MGFARRAAGYLLAAGLIVGAGTAVQAATCDTPDGAHRIEAGLLDWINAERQARGLRPYTRSQALDRAARFHACDMANRGYFNHSRPGGPKLASRIKATGYRLKAGNENIAYSRRAEVASAATIWRNSPPHWAAIIDPTMRDIGIAVSESGGKIYWVMDVARPKGG